MQPNLVPVGSGVATALGGRVLVVEDNPVNQEVVLAMLGLLGYRAEAVADGRQALAALAQQDYDLVLMDCCMPVMDGFAATAELRRRESADGSRRLPVIALTANVIKGFREQCLAAGMDDYLGKPFNSKQLGAVLARWLPPAPATVAAVAPIAAVPAVPAVAPIAAVPTVPAVTPVAPITVVAEPVLDPQALARIRALQCPDKPDLLARIIRIS